MSYSTFNTENITPQYDANNAVYADPTLTPSALPQGQQTINVFNKNFKYEQDVDTLLAAVERDHPDIPVHSKEAQQRLAEARRKEEARFLDHLSETAVDYTDPFVGINWTLEGIFSKTINDMIVKNYDITSTGKTFASEYGITIGDNRPMFQTSTVPYSGIYVLDNVSKGYSYNISIKAEKSFDFGLDAMASYTYGKSKTINNGSSSVAASCWTYNYTHGNPNDPELANSNFNVPHQVMVSLYEHFKWNKDIKDTSMVT